MPPLSQLAKGDRPYEGLRSLDLLRGVWGADPPRRRLPFLASYSREFSLDAEFQVLRFLSETPRYFIGGFNRSEFQLGKIWRLRNKAVRKEGESVGVYRQFP